MKRNWNVTLAAGAAAALILTGCSMGFGNLTEDDEAEVDDSIAAGDAAGGEDPADMEDSGEAADDAEPVGLPELPVLAADLGHTVHIKSMEYTIDSFDVVDLDLEAQSETRRLGARLDFTGSVTNPTITSEAAATNITLQWEDAETGHSHEASGRATSDSVPSGASGPLDFDMTLEPHHLETFDQESSVLLVGQDGYSPAQIPVGSTGELIDRKPVPQEDLIGQTFDIAGGLITVTVLQADLRWDIGDQGDGAEDGSAVLEIEVEKQNNTDGQRCWSRGRGNNFTLQSADGDGTTDLRMNDRGCVPSGDSVIGWTGLPVRDPLAGEYTMTHLSGINRADYEDTVSFTLTDGPGVFFSER